MKSLKSKIKLLKFAVPLFLVLVGFLVVLSEVKQTANSSCPTTSSVNCQSIRGVAVTTPYHCGGKTNRVYTSINLGCVGKGNPIMDMIFGIIRFLSDGVGIIVIASIIVGGIQYIGSRGEPSSTSQAIERIRSAVIAFIIYIFAYAILNYVIPVGFFQR